MQFGHAPIIDILAAAHRVGKVDLPIIGLIHRAQRRCNATFGHHGVGFPKKRFANQPHLDSSRRCLNRRAQSGPACSDNQYVVLELLIRRHQKILQSLRTPIAQSRT